MAAQAQTGIPLFDPEWQLVPEAHKLDPTCPEGYPLGFGGFLQLIQNAMNAAISFGIVIFVLIIAFAGILWILTPTNPENHSQAKKVLTNAVIGLLIVLSAWLIVDFVMKILYNPDAPGFGPWNSIITGGDICIKESENQRPLFDGSITAIPGSEGYTGSGGTCSIQHAGPCAATTLAQYFGSAANQASMICYAESRGVIGSVSRTDIMRNDPQRRAFSFGLFQINLTYHRVAGLDCPSAFRGRNYTARVINEDLYRRCVAAAKNPEHNIAQAVSIYNRTRWREWSTGRLCGLAEANPQETQRGLAGVLHALSF
ncbi:MAG TPA: pilin [Candidatus Paceibacterota bacterium]|nr:pilin [Candidatus Paceibacterota bacterium]